MNDQKTSLQTRISVSVYEKIAVVVMMVGAIAMFGAISFALITFDPYEVDQPDNELSILECAKKYWKCSGGGQYYEYDCGWMLNDCLRGAGYK